MDRLSKSNEHGLSLIESIIAIVGLSIIFLAIFTVGTTTVNLTNYNAKNDQAFQIARSVMEEIKTKLLNYNGGSQLVIGTSQASQSAICKETSEFFCKSDNQEVDLVALSKIVKETESQCHLSVNPSPVISSSDSKTVSIAMRSNQNLYYSVKIEASMPDANAKINYQTTTDLHLCKFIRKFKVTVTPPGTAGNKPVVLEAYFPIPN